MKTSSFLAPLIVAIAGSIWAAPGCSSGGGGVVTLRTTATAVTDPGGRPGAASAGGPSGFFPSLNADEQSLYLESMKTFDEIDSVSGTLPNEIGKGLGPSFNMNSCAGCHVHPDIGGGSPASDSGITGNSVLDGLPIARDNPQIAVATADGATNHLYPFLDAKGPIRECRLRTANGVHGLFTIAGRSDAVGCKLQQEDLTTEFNNGNAVFRIPLSVFGLGLVENISDADLASNLTNQTFGDPSHQNSGKLSVYGITGHLNASGNDGTITRFGWKAQNKSLLMFAGEAYNVEQGVSNILFMNERRYDPNCAYNPTPEDDLNLVSSGASGYDVFSDIMKFTMFMRLSAPPATGIPPGVTQASLDNGSKLFDQVGCSGCHTRAFTTLKSQYTGMSGVTIHPFSDFAVHNMGAGLNDGVSQGNAGPSDFRSTPLWGVGQRVFFLHDGRTRNIQEAVLAHASDGSEATISISQFMLLQATDQQDLINFLRSL
jgi:CxxC motif-containing protein (DUF1111 family)